MNPERYKLISDIVAEILEAPKEQAAVLLIQLCAGDESLRQDVEELLRVNVEESFLQQSPIEVALKEHKEEVIKGKIGRINIDGLIAKGGMGLVYAGVDEVLKRKVAIKIMNSQLQMSKIRRAEFLNEAQVLSSLQHPNICQVYDFFVDNQKDVLVLELINGKTLRQILDDNKLSNPLEIAQQIIDALTVAHERGIVHRDLKPDNIMITDCGTVKILDFGLARSGIETINPNVDANPKLTQVSGTPGYMSPEQARGEKSNTATDLWSFGLILSELLTKKPPFSKTSSSAELLENSKLAKVNLPKNLARTESKLLKQLLSANANDRPTSRSVMETIKQLQGRTKRRILLALSVSVVLLIVLAAWKYTSDLQQERNRAIAARSDAESLVSFMLDDLYSGLKALGKIELLESVANQALSYYDNLSPELMQELQGKPAIAMVYVAQVLKDKGKEKQSINMLKQAYDSLIEIQQKDPGNLLLTYRLAITQNALGDLYRFNGEFDESIRMTTDSIQLAEKLVKYKTIFSKEPTPVSQEKRWSLYLTSINLTANSYREKGHVEKAQELLELAHLKAISVSDEMPNLLSILSNIQFELCGLSFAIGIGQETLDACLLSKQYDEKLLTINPDDFEVKNNYANGLGLLADIYRVLGDYDKSLIMGNKAIEQHRSLLIWDKTNISTQNNLVRSLFTKAYLYWSNDEIEKSKVFFQEAYDIIFPITQNSKDVLYIQHLLIATMYLGKLEQAREAADFLQSKNIDLHDKNGYYSILRGFEEDRKNIQKKNDEN